MLTVTDAARTYLAWMLDDAGAPEGTAIRLATLARGMKSTLDTPVLSDEAFDHEGRTVLVLDGRVSRKLRERTLDVEQTENGPSLTFG